VGISTEIVPIAFLVIIGIWALVQIIRKKITIADLWGKYRLQTVLVLGLIAGLIFFALSGGLARRTGSGYAEVYDYVSPFGILKTPLATGYLSKNRSSRKTTKTFSGRLCQFVFASSLSEQPA
jgi:hypothetical protein